MRKLMIQLSTNHPSKELKLLIECENEPKNSDFAVNGFSIGESLTVVKNFKTTPNMFCGLKSSAATNAPRSRITAKCRGGFTPKLDI